MIPTSFEVGGKMTVGGRALFLCLTFMQLIGVAKAQIFFHDEGQLFIDSEIKKRSIGIEIEFSGVSKDVVLKILSEVFNTKVENSTPLEIELSSPLGKILLKNEGQSWRYENNAVQRAKQVAQDIKSSPLEIVFPPFKFEQIPLIHEVAQRLKAEGAKGTTNLNAVSQQVNVEMAPLNDREAVRDLVNLLRVYFKPEHRRQAKNLLKVPRIRSEFVLGPSQGFLNKLFSSNYHPSAQQLYSDYFYRQSLELLGHREAWTLPIARVRDILLKKPNGGVVPRVVKMNALRISSLLLMAFPDDPLSKRIIQSKWAKAAPIVEFREFNSNFDILSCVKWALGVTRAAQLHRDYDHDKVVSQITGVGEADLQRLRKKLSELSLIRYALQDPDSKPLTDRDRRWLSRVSPESIIIQLDPRHPGQQALRLLEESIVWHRRHIHQTSVLGTYNPGLENHLIQQVMENKIFEAKLLEYYVPGAMPESKTLADILGSKSVEPRRLALLLNEHFPNGWVLKGAWDFGSESEIITDQTDLLTSIEKYEDGFENHRREILNKFGGADPEEIVFHLKKHPGFKGWIIKNLVSNPSLTLVQKREHLTAEFRVEILGTRVLGDGSTIERYGYKHGSSFKRQELDNLIIEAESFAQDFIDRLPPELRSLPYGLDVAKTKDGRWIVIETNPGGNSSFLEENPKSSKSLIRYLKNYPYSVKSLPGLMTESEQMIWIKQQLNQMNMKIEVYYPGMKFKEDSIEDPDFKPKSCLMVLKKAS